MRTVHKIVHMKWFQLSQDRLFLLLLEEEKRKINKEEEFNQMEWLLLF